VLCCLLVYCPFNFPVMDVVSVIIKRCKKGVCATIVDAVVVVVFVLAFIIVVIVAAAAVVVVMGLCLGNREKL
jgi:hypothetical protein